jgi:uncharacterized SAM-binding protein YcdF (DUF218 family)
MVTIWFIIKKTLTTVFQFPGFILTLLSSYFVFLLIRKRGKESLFIFIIIILLYCSSCPYIANSLLARIEQRAKPYSEYLMCDVIVILGGGTERGVYDITGDVVPSLESTGRLVNALRLYNYRPMPIIISAGAEEGEYPEAFAVRRFLLELGIPADSIHIDTDSLDTFQNSKKTKEIMDKLDVKHAALITSAFHMRRASLLFLKAGITHTPLPANPQGEKIQPEYSDFLPSAYAMRKFSLAVKEILGIIFYTLF